jgi:serine/threonine protein kinase
MTVEQPLTAVPPAKGVQTPGYNDPCDRSGGVFTFASDMYSLGIIMLQLLTGEPAYDTTASPPCLSARLRRPLLTAKSDLQVRVVTTQHCTSMLHNTA